MTTKRATIILIILLIISIVQYAVILYFRKEPLEDVMWYHYTSLFVYAFILLNIKKIK